MGQKLIFTNDVSAALAAEIELMSPDRVFVVCDSNVAREVLPCVELSGVAAVFTINPGDDDKNLDTLVSVWRGLTENGATRRSLVVNLGGGVVTDLGGFAAATFKRGIRFVNIPTTLLGAVDAAVGGKTGINFHGLKNEIGCFAKASSVIISSLFFSTLPHAELMSGYAEMLKHGFLSGVEEISGLMMCDPADTGASELLDLLRRSVMVKEDIVERDPTETGVRKMLNFGHTVGHAFESMAMCKGHPVPHGYAVAWGMLAELVLSHMQLGFDSALLHQFGAYVSENYGIPVVDCDDYPELLRLMGHDKKNLCAGVINFTLLRAPGDAVYDCEVSDPATVTAALDIMRDILHC